jgi:O-methyltransferase
MRMFSFLKKREHPHDAVPDREFYSLFSPGMETFRPWEMDPDIIATLSALHAHGLVTLLTTDRLGVIKWAVNQTANLAGEIWEAGVYQGGVAHLLKSLAIAEKPHPRVRLFDSFEGLPERTEGIDLHHRGDFADTSLQKVKKFVGAEDFVEFRQGWIPETLKGLEETKVRFAHIDLDLYKPILDSLEFIYPRMPSGGIIIVDDYGFISCPGARKAVDEFFHDKDDKPLCLAGGNALLVKK